MDAWRPRFCIGRGSFGAVYLLQHADGRKAVDKRVSLDGLSEAKARASREELDLLRRLQHPSVVRLYGACSEVSTLHLLMEYCAGGSLDDAIDLQSRHHRRPFPRATVESWVRQLLGALAFVHENHVLHRDVKPANVLLTESLARAKLADFGVSRQLDASSLAVTCVGTPYYLAPELISGKGYDGRADVWSLGVILYKLLTLRRPFGGESLPQLALQICTAELDPASLPAGELAPLCAPLLQMLRKAAEERPTSAQLVEQYI